MNSLAKTACLHFPNHSRHAKLSLPLPHLAQHRGRFPGSQRPSSTQWRTRTPTISNQRRSTVSGPLHAIQRSPRQTCGLRGVPFSESKDWWDWWETTRVVLFLGVIVFGVPTLALGETLIERYHSRFDFRALLDRQNTNFLKEGQTNSSTNPIYDILKPYEFRVLVLEPGTERGDIRTRLITVNFSIPLRYEALSYAWGDLEACDLIYCDDKRIGIPSNLHSALSHLRHPTKIRILWVDALCIDQHDRNERGHQVKFMKDIYSKAERVLVWVGEETKYVEKAFLTLLRCAPPRELYSLDFILQRRFDWNRDGFDFSKMSSAKFLSGIEWEPVVQLLERPWFTRVWVLQEVAHAQTVTLVCGSRSIDWAVLAIVIRDLQHSGVAAGHFTKKAQAGVAAVTEMENTRANLRHDSRTLLSVLLATASSECSDLRDKIFGVLSLAQEEELNDHPLLEPNYHLSTAEVYKRLAVWHGCFKNNLDFLACGGIPDESTLPELQRLPSWVPDWTRIKNPHSFVRFPLLIPFYAGRRTRTQDTLLSCQEEHGILKIRAKPVSVIKSIGRIPTFSLARFTGIVGLLSERSARNKLDWISECKTMALGNMDCDIFRQNSEVFWRTMLCGLTGGGNAASTEYKAHFDQYLKFLEGAASERQEKKGDNSMVFKRQEVEWAINYQESIAKIESSIYAWASRRRFGVLEDGNMGFFPTDVAIGDQVFVLQDCKVPIILRKESDGFYRVVGEAYVEGIMYGELKGQSVRDYRYYQLK